MHRKKQGNKKLSTSDQTRFSNLPDEVIREIFKFSKPEIILLSFSLVCRRFFAISQMDFLWHAKIEEYFPFRSIPAQNNQNMLTVFKSNYTSGKASAHYPEFSHLFYALKNGEIDKIKKSDIKAGNFFDIKDPAGKSLFDYALLLKQQPVLDFIYELATKVEKETPELRKMPILFWAVLSNQKDEVVRLIQEGASVNESIYPITPLCLAAKHGNLEMATLLLKEGANIDQARLDHSTPLYIATKRGHLEMVKLLLEKGANINQADDLDKTPLYIASKNGHLKIVEALLQKGADINQADYYGETPLFSAAINGHLGVVNALLKANAQIAKVNFKHIDLLYDDYKNPILELKLAKTLKKGIIFLKPDSSTPPYPNIVINVSMIFALEKAHQFLTYERQDDKKASAIRNLIELIYKTPENSFADLVAVWKLAPNSHDDLTTNQSIISAPSSMASGTAKAIAARLIGLVGLFSASHSKALEKKAETDTEALIEDLVTHAKLWSSNSLAQETTASPSIQLKNSSSE